MALATFNPFGPTGGNPMVKTLEIGDQQYWSFYIAIFEEGGGVTFETHVPPGGGPGYLTYNEAYDACRAFYTTEVGYNMPGYTQADVGFTYGNPDVPGFTFNDTGLGLVAARDTPTFPVPIDPP